MSAPAATARYVIAADDKSQNALRSIVKGFKNMDRDVRGTVKTLNSVLGIFVGVQLTQAFRKVLDATAQSSEGQKGFALALGEVRDAAKDLLAAKSGLPEATSKMRELREVLQSPELKSAADAITSTLIAGFAKTAKFVGETVAGLRELGVQHGLFAAVTPQEHIDVNEREIARLQAERDQLAKVPTGRISHGDYVYNPGETKQRIGFIDQQMASLKAENNLIQNFKSFAVDARVPKFKIIDPDDVEAAQKLADELERIQKAHLNDKIASGSAPLSKGGLSAIGSIDPQELEKTRGTFTETLSYLKDTADDVSKEMEKVFGKSLDAMSVYAKEAARNIQDAFADFLFDPFKDGLKGMLRGFIDILRRMAAEQASAQIFGSKKSGGFGLGDFLSSLFGGGSADGLDYVTPTVSKLPTYATGTNYVPRTGPAILHQGEAVIPASQNRGGGGLVINQNISGLGLTPEQLQPVLARNNRELMRMWQDAQSRNGQSVTRF